MRPLALVTAIIVLSACGEDNEPTPTTTGQPQSDPTIPDSGMEVTGGPSTEEPQTTDASVSTVVTSDPSEPTDPGSETDPTATGGDALSWESDIYPAIIAPNCSCHVAGSGGLTMGPDAETAYNAVYFVQSVSGPFFYVLPTSAEMSYLYNKVSGTHLEVGGVGQMMPLGDMLSSDEIDAIGLWIAQGALY